MKILDRFAYTPLSSVHGKIEEVLFVSRYDPASLEETSDRFKGIIEGFDHSVQLLLLGRYLPEKDSAAEGKESLESTLKSHLGESLKLPDFHQRLLPVYLQQESYYGGLARFWMNRLKEKIGNHNVELNPDPKETRLRGWAQDPFVVLGSDSGSTLLEPMFSDRGWAETFVGDQIAAKWGMTLRSTKYNVEGGNILADNGFVFLGADILFRNIHFYCTYNETCAHITSKMKMAFGNHRICWVGISEEDFPKIDQMAMDLVQEPWEEAKREFQKEFHWQPFFHLDLYMTLGGWRDGKYVVFVGDPALGTYRGPYPKPPAVQTRLDGLGKTIEWLDYIGEKLKIPFSVQRLPMVVQVFGEKNGGHSLRCYNFNNVLVEVDNGCRRIYFPNTTRHMEGPDFAEGANQPKDFKLDFIDEFAETARKVYKSAGFHIVNLNIDYRANSKENAGIHCLLKVLKRRRI